MSNTDMVDVPIVETEQQNPVPIPPVNPLKDMLGIIIPDIKTKLTESSSRLSVNLNNETVRIVEMLLNNSPNIFNEIDEAITNVVKDNKIDSNDIPNLIVIIQKLYSEIYNLKTNKANRTRFTCEILKFVVHLLVNEGKIKIEEDKRAEFLAHSDALIESCVGMLSFPKSLKPKGCIKKLFK